MTMTPTSQPPPDAGAQHADVRDPHAHLRPRLRVIGGQGKRLGAIDALERDPATGQLTALVVQHGLLRKQFTRVPASRVKWVNQDSVILELSRSGFKQLPTVVNR